MIQQRRTALLIYLALQKGNDMSLSSGTKNTQVLTLAQVSARNPLLDLVISVWRDKCLISVICDPQPHIKERMYDPLPMERGLRFVF